jgi:hypothetical protein
MLTIRPYSGGDMTVKLNSINHQPFDYQFLKGMLQDYRYPRNKISKMLKSGDIIALKSGLYILSDIFQKPLILETAANLLYGPSYVSLDYALALYGLIPEIAYNVSSVTTGRRKIYQTPVGTFIYHHLKCDYYCLGYRVQKSGDTNYLIASPEKAVCDKLYLSPRLQDANSLEQFLFDDLRLDASALHKLDSKIITYLATVAGNNNLNLLKKLVI